METTVILKEVRLKDLSLRFFASLRMTRILLFGLIALYCFKKGEVNGLKKRWMAAAIIFILMFSLGITVLARKSKKNIEVKTVPASKGKLVSYFSTSGVIESKNKKEYYAQGPVKVVNINASVGDKVKKGRILMEFEVQDLSLQLKTAEMQYENAKLQLKNLKNQKYVSMQAAQNPMSEPSLTLNDQIKIQENQVEIARLNVETIKRNINRQQRYIRADIDGVVSAVNALEGSVAPAQLPVLILEDNTKLKLTLNVNQYDIEKIRNGQTAEIKFNTRKYRGTVENISPVAARIITPAGSDTIIKVDVGVSGGYGDLKSGFDVDADIKIGEKSSALKIPAEAVITDKDNRHKVYIVERGIARIREVTTGLESDTEFEVLKGLNEGDRVILNPQSSIKPGARVVEKNEE